MIDKTSGSHFQPGHYTWRPMDNEDGYCIFHAVKPIRQADFIMLKLKEVIRVAGIDNLAGFRVPGDLEVNAHYGDAKLYSFKDCRVQGDVSIRGLNVAGDFGAIHCGGEFRIEECVIRGPLKFNGAWFGGDLIPGNSIMELAVANSDIQGGLAIETSRLESLSLNHVTILGAFRIGTLHEKARTDIKALRVLGETTFSGKLGEIFMISESYVPSRVQVDKLTVLVFGIHDSYVGELRIRKLATSQIELYGNHIDSDLRLTAVVPDKPGTMRVTLRGMSIRHSCKIYTPGGPSQVRAFHVCVGRDFVIFCRGETKRIDLGTAWIAGKAVIIAEKMDSLLIGDSLVRERVRLSNLTVQNSLIIRRSQFFSGLTLRSTSVHGDAFFDGSLFGSADFSFATFGRNVSFAETTFAPVNGEVGSRAVFLSTDFQHRADFTSTRFYLPTLFRFLELGRVRFDNVWLGLCSFVKCRIADLQLSNIAWLSAHERLGRLRRWTQFLSRIPFFYNSRYDVLIDDLMCRHKRRPELFREFDLAAEIRRSAEPVDVYRLIRCESRGMLWGMAAKSRPITHFALAELTLEKASDLLWNLDSRHAPEAIKTREVISLYQQLKSNYESSGNPVEAGEFFFAEMELKRFDESLKPDGKPRFWRGFFLKNLYRILNGYGERPLRPIAYFAMLAVFSSIIYLYSGLQIGDNRRAGNDVSAAYGKLEWVYREAKYKPALCLPASADCQYYFDWKDLEAAGRYSIKNLLPFIQRSDRSVLPGSNATRTLTILEQFIGAVLIASFLVALRRRYKR